jgi:hypothetical protein
VERRQQRRITLDREDEEGGDIETLTFRTCSAIVETFFNTWILHESHQRIESVVVVIHISRIHFEIFGHFEENIAQLLTAAVPDLHTFFELLKNHFVVETNHF